MRRVHTLDTLYEMMNAQGYKGEATELGKRRGQVIMALRLAAADLQKAYTAPSAKSFSGSIARAFYQVSYAAHKVYGTGEMDEDSLMDVVDGMLLDMWLMPDVNGDDRELLGELDEAHSVIIRAWLDLTKRMDKLRLMCLSEDWGEAYRQAADELAGQIGEVEKRL